jgi:hypothetical protein
MKVEALTPAVAATTSNFHSVKLKKLSTTTHESAVVVHMTPAEADYTS